MCVYLHVLIQLQVFLRFCMKVCVFKFVHTAAGNVLSLRVCMHPQVCVCVPECVFAVEGVSSERVQPQTATIQISSCLITAASSGTPATHRQHSAPRSHKPRRAFRIVFRNFHQMRGLFSG